MSQLLPEFPNLEHLKGQAKDVLRLVRRRMPAWRLARAQHAVARGYGFTDWPELKTHVESLRHRSPVASSRRRLDTDRECHARNEHPIAGMWILNACRTTQTSQHLHDGVLLAFNVSADTITMTQVMVDSASRDVAIKIAIRADGSGQPVRFGKGLILEARLAESDSLEAVIKDGDHIVSQGAYTVSADRQMLTFVTSATQIVFDRMGER
jgi:hypothetical protein